jgi:hypothetical protein
LNDTFDVLSVATYSATGMFTIPNCIEPFQMDRGMSVTSVCPLILRAARRAQRTPASQAAPAPV